MKKSGPILKLPPGFSVETIGNQHLSSVLRPDLKVTRLSPRAVKRIESFSHAPSFKARIKAKPKRFVGVAEGDSWFDYLPAYFDLDLFNGDLIGELNEHPDLHVFKLAKAGDTLENMVYGPRGTGAQLKATLDAIRKFDARFLLFSAGGNDVAGPELERFLYQAHEAPDPKMPVIDGVVEAIIGKRFAELFNHMIDEVKKTSPKIAIFLHGYDYAVPDGRGVINFPFGFTFVGPWLKPAFTNKGIHNPATCQKVINRLIDRVNKTVHNVAKKRAAERIHYVDFRKVLSSKKPGYKRDWANELHPTGGGWKKLSDRFSTEIVKALES